ncbi:MAG: hypothetical protein WCP09_03805 [Candidatus Taylorbacteria bacterium]
MKFFSSRKVDDLSLVLDVQSSAVLATLVLHRENAKPHVILTHRREVQHRYDQKSAEVIRSTINAITHVVSLISKDLYNLRMIYPGLPKKIRSVHYTLSSPWILSESKHIKISFDRPKLITDALIHKILNDEREKLSSESRAMSGALQVEQKIFNVELNGYPISSWVGKEVDALSVSYVSSISGAKMVGRFKDMCMTMVGNHNIFFHSSLFLQYLGIGHMFPHKRNYSIVHVHGEVTDIVVVKNHSCVFFGTYPMGSATILRSISKGSRVGPKTASSMRTLNTSGILDAGLVEDSYIIDQSHDEWLSQLRVAFERGKQRLDDSSTIILSTDVGRDDYSKALVRAFPNVTVELISREDTESEVTYEPLCDSAPMIDLCIIALEKFRPTENL